MMFPVLGGSVRRSAGSRLRLAAVPTRRSDRSIKGDSCLVALSWATAKALSTSTHYHQQQQQERPDVESAPTEGAAERVRWGQEEEATKAQGRNTHFGFKDVAEDDKAGMVGGVFSSVASSYDIMNDAMSLGVHRLWKDHFVSQLNPRGGISCLDVAGGTGDIARRILDHARTQHGDRKTQVTILDINAKMLRAGQKTMRQTMYWDTPQLAFQLGNAEDLATSTPPDFGGQISRANAASAVGVSKTPRNTPPLPALPTLPVPDNSMDLYTIAFGIRNCTHIDNVLAEAYRVLKPGGIFACLEFGKVGVPYLAEAYRQYSFKVIPSIGQILAGDRDSYQYLVESIERFPTQPDFARMVRDAGFHLAGSPEAEQWGLRSLGGTSRHPEMDADVQGAWEDLTFGVASIWHGIKL